MDDDNYFRPYALLGLLAGFNESIPIGFVGAHGVRGLSLTRDRWRACGKICAFRFPWAQPAILSRGAIEKMRCAIDRNYMTESQKVWFGTHDVILGLALWWSSIPLVSLGALTLHHGGLPKARKRKNIALTEAPRSANHRRLVNVAHSESAHLAAHLNKFDGLFQHAVRGADAGDLSAHKLYDALGDESPAGQHQVGVNARYNIKIFFNDGASYLVDGHGPTNRLFLDPADCQGDVPDRILAEAADRRNGDSQCTFERFSYDISPFRFDGAGGNLSNRSP